MLIRRVGKTGVTVAGVSVAGVTFALVKCGWWGNCRGGKCRGGGGVSVVGSVIVPFWLPKHLQWYYN